MTAPDILKASEERMHCTLLVCSREKADSELHKRLIDDLKEATIEFLELREGLFPRIMRELPQTWAEEMVFCDCDHSNVDCTIERWKTCKRRIQKDLEN